MQYQIYDGRNPSLLADCNTTLEAPTAKKAMLKYLANQNLSHLEIVNTASNDVIWQTTPFVERDGQKYKAGRISWWGIKPQKIT